MNGLINQLLVESARRKKKSEVVMRYLRMKYRIQIDPAALKNRKKLNPTGKLVA